MRRNRDFTYAPISLRPTFELAQELDRAALEWRMSRSHMARLALAVGLRELSELPSPAAVEAERIREELARK